jgi:hypothetical protein
MESDESEVQLALFLDGVQVGGAVFPLEFCEGAIHLAEMMGQAYINNSQGLTIH